MHSECLMIKIFDYYPNRFNFRFVKALIKPKSNEIKIPDP